MNGSEEKLPAAAAKQQHYNIIVVYLRVPVRMDTAKNHCGGLRGKWGGSGLPRPRGRRAATHASPVSYARRNSDRRTPRDTCSARSYARNPHDDVRRHTARRLLHAVHRFRHNG